MLTKLRLIKLLVLIVLVLVCSSCSAFLEVDKTPTLLIRGNLTGFSGDLLPYRTAQSNDIELVFDGITIYTLQTISFKVLDCKGSRLNYITLYKEYRLYQLGKTAQYYLQETSGP